MFEGFDINTIKYMLEDRKNMLKEKRKFLKTKKKSLSKTELRQYKDAIISIKKQIREYRAYIFIYKMGLA